MTGFVLLFYGNLHRYFFNIFYERKRDGGNLESTAGLYFNGAATVQGGWREQEQD